MSNMKLNFKLIITQTLIVFVFCVKLSAQYPLSYRFPQYKGIGTVWTWGGNIPIDNRKLLINNPNFCKIANSNSHSDISLALTNMGELFVLSNNQFTQLGNLDSIIEFSAGSDIYAITENGKLFKFNPSKNDFEIFTNDSDWIVINSGYQSTYAIKKNGTLWCWGDNSIGQLGIGNYSSNSNPIQIGVDSNWVNIKSSASNCVMGLKKNGTLWSWGNNNYGQLGIGNTNNSNIPQKIGTDSNWMDFDLGYNFSIAIKQDSTLWGWGNSMFYELGFNGSAGYKPQLIEPTKKIIQIVAGQYATVITLSNGKKLFAGYNSKLINIGFTNKYTYVPELKDFGSFDIGTYTIIGLKNKCKIKRSFKSNSFCDSATIKLPKISANRIIYRYWSTGDTKESIKIKKSGVYFVLEADSQGCVGFNGSYLNFPTENFNNFRDTFICNVKANDTFKLNLNNWFKTSNCFFYDKNKNQTTTADLFIKNSASKKWSGFVSVASIYSLKCPVS